MAAAAGTAVAPTLAVKVRERTDETTGTRRTTSDPAASDCEPRVHGDEAEEIHLSEVSPVVCPYCAETVELIVDPVGGATQEYVEDCEVCCQPWSIRVEVDGLGGVSVSVTTLDE